VAIEGLGPTRMLAELAGKTIDQRMDEWIHEQRALAGRLPRRYRSIEEAFRRMQEENPHLTAEQARHLTAQGVNQNEDGTYSWKFDNYVRAWPPYDMSAGTSPLCGRASPARPCFSMARRASRATRPTMAAWSLSATRGWWASTGPGTGCTTTGWTNSSVSSASFSETREKERHERP
jgi:hypothetical protein